MSFGQMLKGLIFKSPGKGTDSHQGDERRGSASLIGGRREGENTNPYLSARRTWNDLSAANAANRQMWQLLGILSLLIALASVGGMTYIGSLSKFIPFVVDVDKQGTVVSRGTLEKAGAVDSRVVRSTVAAFINDMRMVTPDVALQRAAIFRIYAHLSGKDPAIGKTTDWLSDAGETNPFKRAATEMVSVEISTVLQQTADTWQVEWVETTRDRQGVIKGPAIRMRALVTVYTLAPTSQTTEEQMRNNPLGVYVRDFTWSKQL